MKSTFCHPVAQEPVHAPPARVARPLEQVGPQDPHLEVEGPAAPPASAAAEGAEGGGAVVPLDVVEDGGGELVPDGVQVAAVGPVVPEVDQLERAPPSCS